MLSGDADFSKRLGICYLSLSLSLSLALALGVLERLNLFVCARASLCSCFTCFHCIPQL